VSGSVSNELLAACDMTALRSKCHRWTQGTKAKKFRTPFSQTLKELFNQHV